MLSIRQEIRAIEEVSKLPTNDLSCPAFPPAVGFSIWGNRALFVHPKFSQNKPAKHFASSCTVLCVFLVFPYTLSVLMKMTCLVVVRCAGQNGQG
jgi:hypothetical protein